MATKLLEPIPPGEILSEEFMKPLDLSINALAREIDVPPNRISEIVGGKRAITADTALRLGKYFGVSPEIWLGLQAGYDIRVAKQTTWPKIAEVDFAHDLGFALDALAVAGAVVGVAVAGLDGEAWHRQVTHYCIVEVKLPA
jgi:addiction module HigA family antidote